MRRVLVGALLMSAAVVWADEWIDKTAHDLSILREEAVEMTAWRTSADQALEDLGCVATVDATLGDANIAYISSIVTAARLCTGSFVANQLSAQALYMSERRRQTPDLEARWIIDMNVALASQNYRVFKALLPAYEYAAAEVRRLYAEHIGE